MKSARIMRLAALRTILALALLGLGGSSVAAPQALSAQIKATRQLKVPPVQLRTAQQLAAAAALRPATPPLPLRTKPFLTRLNAAAYRELKAQAAPGHGRQTLAAPQSASPQTTITNTVNFDGLTQPPPATSRRIPMGPQAATILPRLPTPISISIRRPPPAISPTHGWFTTRFMTVGSFWLPNGGPRSI